MMISPTPIPHTSCAGIYVFVADAVHDSIKFGCTRNLNERMWHASYDCFAPEYKRYAFAVSFDFDQQPPAADHWRWLEDVVERDIKTRTLHLRDPLMSTEWRRMDVDDAVDVVRDAVQTFVEMLPEDVRPTFDEWWWFRTPRYCTGLRHLYARMPRLQRRQHRRQRDCLLRAFRRFTRVLPRPDQVECLHAMRQHYLMHDRGHIVQACGVGKALLAVFWLQTVAQRQRGRLHVIGVPWGTLVAQMTRELRRVFPRAPLLCVDVSHTNTTTQIRKWDKDNTGCTRFLITTYASAHKVVNAQLRPLCVVGDECHHLVKTPPSTATDHVRVWAQFWRIVAPRSEVLLMTATPLYSSDDVSDEHTMSNIALFGERLYACDRSVRWAIAYQRITDYEVVVIDHTREEVDKLLHDVFGTTTPAPRQYLLFLSAYVTLRALYNNNGLPARELAYQPSHALIYTNTIAEANTVHKYLQLLLDHPTLFVDWKTGDVYINALHSRTPDSVPDEIQTFRESARGIVACAFLFSEGFDMPELDTVTIAAPMHSHPRIVQSLLRPNRLYTAQPRKCARMLLPTVDIDNDTQFNDAQYANVYTVLAALKTEDDACESKLHYVISNTIDASPTSNTSSPSSTLHAAHTLVHAAKLARLRFKLARLGCTTTQQRQRERHAVRAYNIANDIRSVHEYLTHATHHGFPDDHAPQHFGGSVWRGWSDLLGYDTHDLPKTPDEWRRRCIALGITTTAQYQRVVEQQPHDAPAHLPHKPEAYFAERHAVFGRLTTELDGLRRDGTLLPQRRRR